MRGHSVESPSMVDPPWNYGIEGPSESCTQSAEVRLAVSGGQPIYFGITYVSFIPSRLPIFAVEPQYQHRYFFIFVKYIIWRTQNLQKISCWFKIWVGCVGLILVKLGTSSIPGFLQLPVWCPLGCYLSKHAGDHSMTTEACSSPHLTCLSLCGIEVWKLNWAICAMIVSFVNKKLGWNYVERLVNNFPVTSHTTMRQKWTSIEQMSLAVTGVICHNFLRDGTWRLIFTEQRMSCSRTTFTEPQHTCAF